MGTGKLNAGGNCMQLYGNVKKQFVAQSVICIEKLTTAMENELVQNEYAPVLFSLLTWIIEEETSVHIILQVG